MDTGAHSATFGGCAYMVMLPSGEMSLCPFRERREMEKHVTELWCDRCKRKFERREAGFADTITMIIGWFRLRNGSGSRVSPPEHRAWDNLDKDLCSNCTEEFTDWWKNPPERDTDAPIS